MPTPSLLFPMTMHDGRPALALVTKRVYRIAGNRLLPLASEASVRIDAERVPSVNTGAASWLAHDSDLFAPLKPHCDVLVLGNAWSSRGPVRMLDTGVRLGPLEKRVRVWGRRTILASGGTLRFTEPEPFTSWPLTWDHAYGGVDARPAREASTSGTGSFRRAATTSSDDVDLRNPAGRGFFVDVDRERLHDKELPNLEDPRDAVTPSRLLARRPEDWRTCPAPACYAPVDWTAHPRLSTWLVLEPSARIHRLPSTAAYNCAPPGLRGPLRGNERMSLWNLDPKHEIRELPLPGELPRLLIEPPGCNVQELASALRTVVVEPDAERVTLTWAGAMEVAAPFPQEACATMRSAVRWQA